MSNITLQEAAHKNVILWKLMKKLDFWKARKTYDANRKAVVMSLGRPTGEKHGYWCNTFNFDRLKFLDEKGNTHIYEFHSRESCIWQARSEFNFFPTGASRTTVFARAELLDHLANNFTYGMKWKKEKLMLGAGEFAKSCIDIELNFNESDCQLENSIVDSVEFCESFNKTLSL